MSRTGVTHASGQRGVALVVVLLLLLVVTLLGLAVMRTTIMQERMAANSVARSGAFQVAEAGLRVGEAYAGGLDPSAIPPAGCVNGVCARPANPGDAPAWAASGFWDAVSGAGYLQTDTVNGIRAKYVVEDYGMADSDSCTGSIDMSSPPCDPHVQVYRVTVHSQAPDGAMVTLQSLYEVP